MASPASQPGKATHQSSTSVVWSTTSISQGPVSCTQIFGERKFNSEALGTPIHPSLHIADPHRTGDFAMTANIEEHVFIKDEELWIKPTLQDESLINQNIVVDLKKERICTSKAWENCHAVTNTTNGTIINPVKSARSNTKKGASIQYGNPTRALPFSPTLSSCLR